MSTEPEHGAAKFLTRCASAWEFSPSDIAAMLGFADAAAADVYLHSFRRGDEIGDDDVAARWRLALQILTMADGLYDDDAVVMQWLSERPEELGGRSPRELMVSGSREGLAKVHSYLRYIGGL